MVVIRAGRPGVNVRTAVEWERNFEHDHAPIPLPNMAARTATALGVQERRRIACTHRVPVSFQKFIRRVRVSFRAFMSKTGLICSNDFERKTVQNNTYSFDHFREEVLLFLLRYFHISMETNTVEYL